MSSISAGTTSTTTLIHSGDTTGSLVFKTNDTGSGGTTAVTLDTSQNATFAGKVTSAGALTLASNGTTTAVTIDTSQNVGIGTASPTNRLDIQAAKAKVFATSTTGTNDCYFAANNTGGAFQIGLDNSAGTEFGTAYAGVLYRSGAYPINFYTNANERMRIDSSGNLLVGQTAQTGTEKFGVTQSATGSNAARFYASSTSFVNNIVEISCARSGATTEYNAFTVFDNNTTLKMLIRPNGNLLNANNSYGSLSDVSLKENIVDATPKLDGLMQVKVRNYNLKDDVNKTKQIGVIAQELETVFPSMIEEDKDGIKSVKYSVFVPMLVKAIQELKAINDQQAETINALTARVVALEGQ